MANGEELHAYIGFTGRQRRDTALFTLEGLLSGVQMDQVINPKENREILAWLIGHDRLTKNDPVFAELVRGLRAAIADGCLTAEEMTDLHALCQRAKSTSKYYDGITHSILELHGILHGLVADLAINADELRGLRNWIDEYQGLRGIWPITEIEAAIVKVLSDGRVDDAEQRVLLHYFSQFVQSAEIQRKLPGLLPSDLTINGVCTSDPFITFSSKIFCFTGVSSRGPRQLFAKKVEGRGGMYVDHVRKDLDYLVIGDEGNPCWAFSCYGRKVAHAVELRREGHRLLLIHECDFWDALVV